MGAHRELCNSHMKEAMRVQYEREAFRSNHFAKKPRPIETGMSYRVVRLDLPVEQPVLHDPGVAVHGPHQPEGVPARLVGLVAEHGRGRTAVHLDVASRK